MAPLQPNGKWLVQFAHPDCLLSRAYGSGKDQVVWQLPGPPSARSPGKPRTPPVARLPTGTGKDSGLRTFRTSPLLAERPVAPEPTAPCISGLDVC